MTENIYINGKIQNISIYRNNEYNATEYLVNGKKLSQEKAFKYLKEFQDYPSYKMEKYTHPNNKSITILHYDLIEEL